ncbi:hypothetical protein SESBI_46005, partial [Sesbania bispinosa]
GGEDWFSSYGGCHGQGWLGGDANSRKQEVGMDLGRGLCEFHQRLVEEEGM